MTHFGGTYSGKLDDKGRVPLPAPFRNLLEEGDKEQIYCRIGEVADCLKVYTKSAFDEKCAKMYEKFDEENDEDVDEFGNTDVDYLNSFFKNSFQIAIDSTGRILLSKILKNYIKAENEVTFSGNGKCILISKKEVEEDQTANLEMEKATKARLRRKKELGV